MKNQKADQPPKLDGLFVHLVVHTFCAHNMISYRMILMVLSPYLQERFVGRLPPCSGGLGSLEARTTLGKVRVRCKI